MRRFFTSFVLTVTTAVLCSGCSEENGQAKSGAAKAEHVVVIEPGENAQKDAQTALIKAKPGDVIEFAEGDFQFNQTLSLEDVEGVTIRGRGADKTRLNFKDQVPGAGGEGILVKSGNFTIEDMTVQDTRGDAIKVEGVNGVTFRNVKVEWTRGPHPDNGAYGVYPVLCENVLIEGCTITDCSDAGVYVGQSKNVIVRRNHAERNVAGIEIENTIGADVYENTSTNNAGGMLVFSLPGLKQKVGSNCRVYNNKVWENNHANFAKPGNIVATVPPGSGLIIMANDKVEVFDNEIRDNQTANVSIISYFVSNNKFDDPGYDPYPEGIHIHHNRISGGGEKPQGDFGALVGPLLQSKAPELTHFPDIIYDGIVNPEKLVDGTLPPEDGIYIHDNGDDVTFAFIDLGSILANKEPNISTDLEPYAKPAPFQVSAIKIEGVE
jgi:parallel beta-helix repeat protein